MNGSIEGFEQEQTAEPSPALPHLAGTGDGEEGNGAGGSVQTLSWLWEPGEGQECQGWY